MHALACPEIELKFILKSGVSYFVTLYSILCLVLKREAAENIGRPDKAVSPTYFNT